MTFPLRIEVTAMVNGEKEIKILQKTDFPKGQRTDFKIIEALNMCFASPNFQWKILD